MTNSIDFKTTEAVFDVEAYLQMEGAGEMTAAELRAEAELHEAYPAWLRTRADELDAAETLSLSPYLPPFPGIPEVTADDPVSLQLLEAFREAMRPRVAASTLKLRVHWVRRFIETKVDVLSVTTEDLIMFSYSNELWSPNTRQTLVSSLRLFYGWLFDSGVLTVNPAARLTRVRVPRRTARIAKDSAIMAALEDASITTAAIIRLGAECGLRLAEISSLRLSCRDGEWLTVVGKGSVERSLYMGQELQDLLTEIETTKMRWGYYFPGKYKAHLAPSTVWRLIRDTVGVNTHALRHRAGTTVYERTGHDIRVTQEFLGHSSPATTAIYVHVERDALVRAGKAAQMPFPQ